MIDVNLGAVTETQPLTVPGPYTLGFRKVELRRNKADDGDLIYTEVLVDGHPADSFIHRFSLKPGALTSRQSSISLKKFFEVLDRDDLANTHITEANIDDVIAEIAALRFSAMIKHEMWNGEPQVRLDSVLEAA
jgi:hypothetical protein